MSAGSRWPPAALIASFTRVTLFSRARNWASACLVRARSYSSAMRASRSLADCSRAHNVLFMQAWWTLRWPINGNNNNILHCHSPVIESP